MSITNTFSASTLIKSADVNTNFTDIRTLINGQIDGVDNISSIITANKVSGAALYLLGNIPSGAGLIPSANLDRFNPQIIRGSNSQTEGAGTTTDMSFGAGVTTIVVTTDGNLSVFLFAFVMWTQNDVTGGITLRITDSANTAIGNAGAQNMYLGATASELYTPTLVFSLDTRPAASSKTYKVRFERVTAGTVTLDERDFIAITFPDPA